MKISKFILISVVTVFSLLGSCVGNAFDDAFLSEEKLSVSGYLKNETSVRMAGMDEFMKIENTAQLETEYRFTDWLHFFITARPFYEAVYAVEDRYEQVSFEDVQRELRFPTEGQWLRECFFDLYTDIADIRLGKQQVVWGTADGVKILDRVCPTDMREFTLDNSVDSRIPLWMLNLEVAPTVNSTIQFLLIPDYQPNYYAPAGAPFAYRTVEIAAQPIPGVTVKTIDERPEHTFRNSKIGVRWLNVIKGFEYTLNYLHTYNFASSAYTAFTVPPPTVYVTRRAEQVEIAGGSFSKTITKGLPFMGFLKGWTLRGEFAWIHNDAINYGTDEHIEGTVTVDNYNYVLGFDKNFWTNWLFSFQFIQLVTEPKDSIPSQYSLLFGPTRGPLDEVETMLTLKVATDFMHERLKPEVLIMYGDDNDWRLSPRVTYEITDNWIAACGMNIFEGKPQHLNGEFDKNDQVYVELKYGF